jgi:hypothetical protein
MKWYISVSYLLLMHRSYRTAMTGVWQCSNSTVTGSPHQLTVRMALAAGRRSRIIS